MANLFFISMISSLLSLTICILFTTYLKKYLLFGEDENFNIQNIHNKKALRIGGLSVVVSFLVIGFLTSTIYNEIYLAIFFSILIFLLGFSEDILMSLSPSLRFKALLIISTLTVLFTDYRVNYLEIDIFDQFFSIYYVSSFFTIIGLVATSNAWNMIDGLNGLSSGLAIITLLSFSYLVYGNDDKILSALFSSISS